MYAKNNTKNCSEILHYNRQSAAFEFKMTCQLPCEAGNSVVLLF